MPRLTKAQIATLSDDDLLQRANTVVMQHRELTLQVKDFTNESENSVIFKQRRKLRQQYRKYEDILLARYVDASRTRDAEYFQYYSDVIHKKLEPLYKIT